MQLPALALITLLSPPADAVVVRVLSADGQPLESANVYAEIPDAALPEDDWESAGETTDGNGIARLDLDPGAVVNLWVDHRLHGQIFKTLEPGESYPVEIRLPEPPWELVDVPGRVVSPRGEPAEGVTVRMSRAIEHAGWPWTAVTDAEGRFTMSGVMEDGYRVELEAAGYLRMVESAAVFAGMPPLEFRLRSSVQVVGTIVGDRELEVSRGWSVHAISADRNGRPERTSCFERIPEIGADGFGQFVRGRISGHRFRIRLPVGTWTINATSTVAGVDRPWRARAEVRLEEGAGPVVHLDLEAEDYCLELSRGAAVPMAGRVFDEVTGEPVPHARVSWGGRLAETAADGSFELPVGDISDRRIGWVLMDGLLHVRPPGPWAPARVDVPEGGSRSLEIPLRRAIGFCYEIRWADGEPARLSVRVFAEGEDDPIAESETDERGRGCVAELPAGRYEIEGVGHYWRDGRLPFSIPTERLALEVPVLGAVQLRAPEMMRDYGLRPPDGTVVRFEPLDGAAPRAIVRESPPHFFIGGIPPGRWLLTLVSPDGRKWSSEVDIVARDSSVVVVR